MNGAGLVVFGLACAGVGAVAMFFVNLVTKEKTEIEYKKNAEMFSDNLILLKLERVWAIIEKFEESYKDWRSPKANRIAVEKLIEDIKSHLHH